MGTDAAAGTALGTATGAGVGGAGVGGAGVGAASGSRVGHQICVVLTVIECSDLDDCRDTGNRPAESGMLCDKKIHVGLGNLDIPRNISTQSTPHP